MPHVRVACCYEVVAIQVAIGGSLSLCRLARPACFLIDDAAEAVLRKPRSSGRMRLNPVSRVQRSSDSID